MRRCRGELEPAVAGVHPDQDHSDCDGPPHPALAAAAEDAPYLPPEEPAEPASPSAAVATRAVGAAPRESTRRARGAVGERHGVEARVLAEGWMSPVTEDFSSASKRAAACLFGKGLDSQASVGLPPAVDTRPRRPGAPGTAGPRAPCGPRSGRSRCRARRRRTAGWGWRHPVDPARTPGLRARSTCGVYAYDAGVCQLRRPPARPAEAFEPKTR